MNIKQLSVQEARTVVALAEAESRQQREAIEQEAAQRALKQKAKKARRQQAKAAGQGHPVLHSRAAVLARVPSNTSLCGCSNCVQTLPPSELYLLRRCH